MKIILTVCTILLISEFSVSNPVDDEFVRDSIRFEVILNDALVIAQQQVTK